LPWRYDSIIPAASEPLDSLSLSWRTSGNQINCFSCDTPSITLTQNTSVTLLASNGCNTASATADFNLNAAILPTLTFNPDVVCNGSGIINLSGGWPMHGVYSGPYVSNGQFNAGAAGAGIYDISYTYVTPVTGCIDTVTTTLKVQICSAPQ
jgi:hypothetical protein